jgi:hypothetical protein
MKRLLLSSIFLALLSVIAHAQDPARLQMEHLDRLFPRAVETVDVTVDSGLLRLASRFIKTHNPEQEQAIKEVVAMLKGVYVKGVEFDKEGEYTEQDVETVRQQLRTPGWERIVGVRSKRDGDNVEVYLMHNGEVIHGVGVLIFDPKQLMVVNVVGPLDPEKISYLIGQFGIPKDLDLDFSGAKRTRRSN